MGLFRGARDWSEARGGFDGGVPLCFGAEVVEIKTEEFGSGEDGAIEDGFRVLREVPGETEQGSAVAEAAFGGETDPAPEGLALLAAEIEVGEGPAGGEGLVDFGGLEEEAFGLGGVVLCFGGEGEFNPGRGEVGVELDGAFEVSGAVGVGGIGRNDGCGLLDVLGGTGLEEVVGVGEAEGVEGGEEASCGEEEGREAVHCAHTSVIHCVRTTYFFSPSQVLYFFDRRRGSRARGSVPLKTH